MNISIKKIFVRLLVVMLSAVLLAPLGVFANADRFAVTLRIRYMSERGESARVETFYVVPGLSLQQVAEGYSRVAGGEYVVCDDYIYLTVTSGMFVNLYEIYSVRSASDREIPYEVQLMFSDNLPEGYRHTIVSGQPGTMLVLEEVRYKLRTEVSRLLLHEEVTQAPVDAVIAIGNGPIDLPMPADLEYILADLRPVRIPVADIQLTERQLALHYGENRLDNTRVFMPIPGEEEEHLDSDYGISVINGYSQLVPAHYIKIDEYLPFHVEGNFIYINGESFEFSRQLSMSSTAYNSRSARRPGDPLFGVTASGLRAQPGVVAVDRNVIPLFTLLFIEGYGFAIAGDTGGGVRGNSIDLYFDTTAAGLRAHGRQRRNVFILADQSMEIAIQH